MRSNSYPKVSVVIPTYNSASTLRVCLESIKRQSYQPHEVIIIDSFSKDSTIQIAKEFGAKIITHKGFPSKKRNIGVGESSSNYILFLDSDEIVENHVVQQCVELCENGADYVCFRFSFVGHGFLSSCSAVLKNALASELSRIGEDRSIPRFFHKRVLISAGSVNENLLYGEDRELYLRLRAHKFREAPLKLNICHVEPSSLKKVMFKEFRYGKTSHLVARYGVKPWTKIALISTAKRITLCHDYSPLLKIGALFTLLLRSFARIFGIIIGRSIDSYIKGNGVGS